MTTDPVDRVLDLLEDIERTLAELRELAEAMKEQPE